MGQGALNLDAPSLRDARRMGEDGMTRAAEHAERVDEGFAEKALRFLCWYAGLDDDPFSSEAVTEMAAAIGLTPPDGRAWGWVFRRAAGLGVIERSNVAYLRQRGHGAPSLKWVARQSAGVGE